MARERRWPRRYHRDHDATFARIRFWPRRNHRHVARFGVGVCAEGSCAARGRDRPHQYLSARVVAEAWRSWSAGHDGRAGIWRSRHGLSRALCCDGRVEPCIASGRSVLRRAFESVRESIAPLRQRGAEAEISASARFGRASGRARDERAERRLGCRQHETAGGRARRRFRTQRHEDVDHQRAWRRRAGRLCDGRSGAGAQGHHGVSSSKKASRDFRRATSSTSSACAVRTRAS